jgi:hypothetical protein
MFFHSLGFRLKLFKIFLQVFDGFFLGIEVPAAVIGMTAATSLVMRHFAMTVVATA